MLENFNKYPLYKASEIEWLEEIPSHWDVIKVKHIFKERVEKGYPDKPLLAATQSGGVIKKEDYETNTVTAQKDFHLLKLVKIGDFVISLRSFQGGIEISYEEGIISPAYTIMKPIERLERNYFKHLFKAKYFIDGLTTFVTGIREGQNIDYSKFRRSMILLPPLKEQTVIANFLDKKTAEIKEFIALKEKTIELLKERKMAIINELVTGKKVWDGNAWTEPSEINDSETPWFSKIPKNWNILPNRYIFDLKKIQVGKKAENYKLLSLTTNGVSERDLENPIGKFPSEFNTYQEVKKGDFIFCLFDVEETPRTVGLSDYEGMITGAYTVFRNRPDQNAKFLYYFYLILDERKQLKPLYKGLRNTISKENFYSFKVLIPDYSEQTFIANFLDKKTAEINDFIIKIKKEIELIKEYQQSLISEVVTGKVDVSSFTL